MFGREGRGVESLESLLDSDALRTLQQLMKRALRMGVVSREMEAVVSGRMSHLAVTVSSLGPRRANTGYVLVFDDLTEVLRAQKSAAWQEVARRIAHEIKNPAHTHSAFRAAPDPANRETRCRSAQAPKKDDDLMQIARKAPA